MKYIDLEKQNGVLGKKLEENEFFSFRCHEGLGCFTQCCRNLNLFLHPYDVLRLKNRLNISSEEFLDTHMDIVLRESNFFPDVLLRMAENEERTCPFLNGSGCTVLQIHSLASPGKTLKHTCAKYVEGPKRKVIRSIGGKFLKGHEKP